MTMNDYKRAVRAGAAILIGTALVGTGIALYEPPVPEEETARVVNRAEPDIVGFSEVFGENAVSFEEDEFLEFEMPDQQDVQSEPIPLFVNAFGQEAYDTVSARLEAAGLLEQEDRIIESYVQIEDELALLATAGIDLQPVFENLIVPTDLVELIERYNYLRVNEEDTEFAAQYVQDAFEDSGRDTASVLVYGIPYRRSGGERIATPDLLIDVDIALELMNNRDTDITIIKLNNQTQKGIEHNQGYDQFLRDSLPEIGPLLGEARIWRSEHPEAVLENLSTEEVLSAFYWIVRDHDVSYLTFTVHGDSNGLLLSLSDSGQYMPVRFETLADYLVRGIADGDVEKLVLRLNQCGGYDIAENLLSAVHESYLSYNVPEEKRPEILLQLSSVNSVPYNLVNIVDYPFARFAMALNKNGIMTDLEWEQYNTAGAAAYDGLVGGFSLPLYQGTKGIDLEVKTYTLSPDGFVSGVDEGMLEPFVLGSYVD